MIIFRKSALIFIVVVAAITAGWIFVARNGLVERAAEAALERMLDAPVEINGLVFNPFTLQAGFKQVRIANPDRPDRYLIEAGPAAFDVNLTQIFAGKVVIREMSLKNVALGAERPEGKGVAPRPQAPPAPPAPPAPAGGKPAPEASKKEAPAKAAESGALGFTKPDIDVSGLLQDVDVTKLTQGRKLTSVETIGQTRDMALEKIKLWQQRYGATTVPQDLRAIERDSQALRFNAKTAAEAQALLKDLQSLKKRLDSTNKQVSELSDGWKKDQKDIRAGWDKVSTATEEDIRTIKAAAKLGNIDASQIGKALFGTSAVDQFDKMLGYLKMARKALKSDKAPAQSAPRRSGRLIAFPVTARVYPGFALEKSAYGGSIMDKEGKAGAQFEGKLLALTSDAATYGLPATLTAEAKTAEGRTWKVDGLFDERKEPGVNGLSLRGASVHLGGIDLPRSKDGMYPEQIIVPQGDVELAMKLTGEALEGQLRIVARKVNFRFAATPAVSGRAAEVSKNLRAAFDGIQNMELKATLSGTLSQPKFDVSSTIDKVISDRLKGLLGKRMAEIDGQIRSAVNAQVSGARAQAEAQVKAQQDKLNEMTAQMDQRMNEVRKALDQRAKQAEAEQKKGAERQLRDALKLPRR